MQLRCDRHVRRATALLIAAVVACLAVCWQGAASAAGAPASAVPAADAPASGAPSGQAVKFYIVQSSFQGKPEFLFEIAQRFLGEGQRLNEIFELNKGRLEPDGQTVSNPNVIEPGWILQLPPDAKGPGVQFAPLPVVTVPQTTAPAGNPNAGNPTAGNPTAGNPGAGNPSAGNPGAGNPSAAQPARHGSTDTGLYLVVGLVVVVLVIAGVAAYLWRRRGGGTPSLPRRRRRRAGHSPALPDASAAWAVDRALRALATGCARTRRPLPDVIAVIVSTQELLLRMSAPDGAAPAGWTARDDGRTWAASLRDMQTAPVDEAVADPYPLLVIAGSVSTGRLLLNLGQPNGVISVSGDGHMQRAVVDDWSRQLAVNPWSRTVTVVRAGFGELAPTAAAAPQVAPMPSTATPPHTVSVPSTEEALRHLSTIGGGPGAVFLARAPSGRDAEFVRTAAARSGPGWATVIASATKGAAWSFEVHPDGRLDTGFIREPAHTGLPEREFAATAGAR